MNEDQKITYGEFRASEAKADIDAQRRANEAAKGAREWMKKNVEDGGVCDFCAHLLEDGKHTTWVTESEIVTALTGVTHEGGRATVTNVMDPFWAACTDRCDAVVAERDPVKLAKHALDVRDVERVGEIRDRELVERDLVKLYTEFYAQNPTRVEPAGENVWAVAEDEDDEA